MKPGNRKAYNFRFPPSLVERIDRVRGTATRTDFVEQAISEKLAEHERFGRYVCPRCDYTADSAAAICPHDGRRVVPRDRQIAGV